MFRTTYLETYKNFTRALLALPVSDLEFMPAGQVIGGDMEVEDVAMALERLEACRRRSDELVEFLKYGEWEINGLGHRERFALARRLNQCALWVVFRDYFDFVGGDFRMKDVKLTSMIHCGKEKICPCCAGLRAGRLSIHFAEIARQLVSVSGGQLAHIVLTIRNHDDLADVLGRVRAALFGLVRRRKSYELFLQGKRKRKRPYSEWIKIKGGVWTVEIKRGEGSGCWHPHVHMLALLDSPLDMEAFRREWFHETGGEGVNVKALWINDAHTSQGAYREIFKYICKFSTMSFEDNLHVYAITSRMHLRGKFGCFRNVELDGPPITDELYKDDRYFKDVLFVWDKETSTFHVEQERTGELSPFSIEPKYTQFAKAKGELTVALNYDTHRFAINALDFAERQSDSSNLGTDSIVPF